jgi:alcohol dehydrogenase
MDAMIHAVESYLSIRNNPYSDGIALQTIELVMKNLLTACKDGSNLEARANMLLASHIVGVGFSHTGLGLVHGIGHSLGGHFNVPHGVALCTVLDQVLRFNLPVRQPRLAKIAQALGVADTAKSEAENADKAIKSLVDLAKAVGLGTRLSDHGITEADLPLLAKTAVEDAVTLNNPIKPTEQDVLGILRSAL